MEVGQRLDLADGERERVGTDLHEPPAGAQPGEGNSQRLTTGKDEVRVRGHVTDEVGEQPCRRRRRPKLVEVVEHQAHVEGGEVAERGQHGLGGRPPTTGGRTAEGGGDHPRQPRGILVAGLARHPRVDAPRLDLVGTDRLSEQCALSESRAGDDRRHWDLEAPRQLLDQAGAHQLARQGKRRRRSPAGGDRPVVLGH